MMYDFTTRERKMELEEEFFQMSLSPKKHRSKTPIREKERI